VEPTVKVLLRSSAKADALVPLKGKKGAIHLKHMVHLAVSLASGGPKAGAIFDLALVAFWGMARLGKLTSPFPRGKLDPRTLVFLSDVAWENSGDEAFAVLTLRDAKTCKPGKTQLIKLRPLTNLLCPIEAVKRRLAVCREIKSPTLFSHAEPNGEITHLTKDTVNRGLHLVWEQGGYQNLTGHFLRVGGASMRYAMGVKTKEICKIGRWTSTCYKLYI
jgi:hypothetical protein